MGWHLFVLQATGPAATAATVVDAGYPATEHRMTVDEAISDIDDLAPEGIALVEGRADGLEAVARFNLDDDLAAALSADGGQALAFVWQSVSDIYMLSVFRDGGLHRRLVRAVDEVAVDEGPALEAEAGIDWSDDEDALFAIATALTGEPIGTHDWLTRPAVVHRRRAG